MATIRIRAAVASDTPHLPGLAPLVGKAVTITVEEAAPAGGPHDPAVLAAALRAAEELRASGFDFDFYDRYDEFQRRAAERGPG